VQLFDENDLNIKSKYTIKNRNNGVEIKWATGVAGVKKIVLSYRRIRGLVVYINDQPQVIKNELDWIEVNTDVEVKSILLKYTPYPF
jgi:hypothetical protein